MYDRRKERQHESTNADAHSVSGIKQRAAFADNRPVSAAYQTLSSAGQQSHGIAQPMLVAQLATRLSSAFQFNGTSEQLRLLILQWGPPNGTRVLVQQTDFVGGMFKVRFTNTNGPAISKEQADDWVQRGIDHFEE